MLVQGTSLAALAANAGVSVGIDDIGGVRRADKGGFVRQDRRWGGIVLTIAFVLAFGFLESVFGIHPRLAAAVMLVVVFLGVVVSRRWWRGGDTGTAPGPDREDETRPPGQS